MTQLPPDLQEALRQIDDADRAADTLVAGLSDAQVRWQPDGGRAWSIAQCLEHLALINDVYAGAARHALDDARARGWTRRGPIQSSIFGRTFIAQMEPPVRRRFKAPKVSRPGSTASRDEILRSYHAAHDTIRDLIQRSAEVDVNRATFKNPFLPFVRVRLGTALLIMAAHDRRHLWQAERVRRAPGFPASD